MKVPQAKDENPTRAAFYARVSTQRQADEGFSLGEQQRRAVAFIESRGWQAAGRYVDVDTGRRDDRPRLVEMMRAAERGEFDVLVIPKVDRFGRSFRHSAELKGRLDDAGVRLTAMDMGVDFSSGVGLLVWANLTAVAQMESETIGDRVRYTAEARARSGKLYGSREPPYGYKRGDGTVEVDPATATIVRRIFAEAAAGRTRNQITADLNADGIPTPRGAKWGSNVGRMLRNRTYYGAVVFKGEVVCEQGEHEPLVDRALWDRARAAVEARHRLPASGGGRPSKSDHLLQGGLLRCGACGESLRVRTHATGTGSYFCDHGANHHEPCALRPIDRDVTDAMVVDYFRRVGLDVDATRDALVGQHEQTIARASAMRAAAERQVSAATSRLARVRRDYQDGRLKADDWNEQAPDLRSELAAAEAEAAAAARAEDAARADHRLSDEQDEVLRAMGTLRDAATRDDRARLRTAIRSLFEAFVVHATPTTLPPFSLVTVSRSGGGGALIVPVPRQDAIRGYTTFYGIEVPDLYRVPLHAPAPELARTG